MHRRTVWIWNFISSCEIAYLLLARFSVFINYIHNKLSIFKLHLLENLWFYTCLRQSFLSFFKSFLCTEKPDRIYRKLSFSSPGSQNFKSVLIKDSLCPFFFSKRRFSSVKLYRNFWIYLIEINTGDLCSKPLLTWISIWRQQTFIL